MTINFSIEILLYGVGVFIVDLLCPLVIKFDDLKKTIFIPLCHIQL